MAGATPPTGAPYSPAYALVFTEQYNRKAARFLKRHPDLRQQYLKTLQVLELNPAPLPCAYTPCTASSKGCTLCPSTCRTASRWSY
jgi:hypothetical protein